MKIKKKQAGAELCQAQYKLELAKFWYDSVASLKFDWYWVACQQSWMVP